MEKRKGIKLEWYQVLKYLCIVLLVGGIFICSIFKSPVAYEACCLTVIGISIFYLVNLDKTDGKRFGITFCLVVSLLWELAFSRAIWVY